MYKLQKFYPKGFDAKAYWEDKYAKEHIAGKSSDEFRRQGFWPVLEAILKRDGQYLDAGCGIGGWIIFLKEQGFDVEGIDTSQRALQAMTEYDPDIRVKQASITSIPAADSTYDGVVALGTLEYVEDTVPQTLEEVRRVLKNDGFFFMEVPLLNVIRRWIYLPLKRVQYWVRTRGGDTPTFANYLFNRRTLVFLLEEAGFAVETVRTHELPGSYQHYGLYIDWPFLRGGQPYQLNRAGLIVKKICNFISPWIASTGMVLVARKIKKQN